MSYWNNKYNNNNVWQLGNLLKLAIRVAFFAFLIPFGSIAQQAEISGDTTICSGGTVDINLSLEGVAPWSVTIRLNNSITYQFNNIYAQDTILRFPDNGEFEITEASDSNGTISFSSNTVIAILYPLTQAYMSGAGSICEEGSYNVGIELYGDSPWSIIYQLNGGGPIEVNNIASDTTTSPYTYNFNVSEEGTYSLLSVSDKNCTATANGTFTLSHYEKSTAYLVGGEEKCSEKTTPLTVILSGSAPYDLEYMRDEQPEGTIENIANSPFTFKVSEPGEYGIYQLTDNNGCIGTASGSATVTNYPPVEIKFVNLSSTYALNSSPVELEATPAGGEFKGDGVVISTSTFYPSLAVEYGEMPYEIIYTYQQPTTGCTYVDTAEVNIIDSTANIIFPGGEDMFCTNEEPITITGVNIYNETGSFSISGGTGLTNNGDNTATIDPKTLNEGEYLITYTYWNGSSNEALSREITIESVDEVFFILDNTEFCGDDPRIVLNGSELDGVFSGAGVESDTTDVIKYYFNPAKAEVGTNELVFSYTNTAGCTSSAMKTVQVYGLPRIDFITVDSCVNEDSPRPIKFVNQTESEDEVVSWAWDFNDFGSSQDTSSEENPTYVYQIADNYDVSLEATTDRGCDTKGVKRISFGESPLASFVFSSECLNSDTSILFAQTVISKSDIDNYQWIFTDKAGSEVFYGDSVYYKFILLDEHLVKLITKTTEGCVDTFEENIQLKPTFKISDGPYFQDFENQNYWENEFSKALNNNSWVFGATDGSYIKTEDNNAWYTLLDYQEEGGESSWIKSPCFDFTGVERPFVRFNIWRDFEELRDGANFQYTLDNGNIWNLVGTVNDGTNWYNSYQINGNPGGHDEGWSDLKDNNWVTVKHRLDELSEKTNVQFRIVYGSDGTNNENYGVAFDNIYFGERNHVVLLEHFTNSSDEVSLTKDSLINELRLNNINDLIDIQYHTDFPGSDPMNLVNPLEINARLLYYGYSSVPLSIVDGINTYDFINNSLTNIDIIKKSLNASNFEISFEANMESDNLKIDYSIKSLDSQNNKNLYLYIVILEDSVKQLINDEEIVFMNTFRKFLPDPAGISLPSNWTQNEVYSNNYTWEVENVDYTDNMKVVLFIQDEQSNEVVQAAIDKKLQLVNVENYKEYLNKINVYPNPFDNNLFIMRDAIQGSLKMDLLSISGNILFTSILEETEYNLKINSELPSGLYFLRITELKTGYKETIRVIKY